MKKLLTILFLLISYLSFSQSGYLKIQSRYRLIAVMGDSTLHIPVGAVAPSSATQLRGGFNGAGALYYDTVANLVYVWNHGAGWTSVGSLTTTILSDSLDNYWRLTGNSILADRTNFLGTTNNVSLPFRTNNTQKMVLDSNGRLGIGTNAPTKQFSITENLWAYTDHVSGTQSRIESSSGRTLVLSGGGTNGVYIIPNGYGSTPQFRLIEDPDDAARVYISMYNSGATESGRIGIKEKNLYLHGKGDSTGIQLRSQDKAAVAIDSSIFSLSFVDTITAANDLVLAYRGNIQAVSGGTQINAITTFAKQKGTIIHLKFVGTPTVKDNTAGGAGTAVIQLSGNSDYTPAAGDILSLLYDGVDWGEMGRYQPALIGSASNISNTSLTANNDYTQSWAGKQLRFDSIALFSMSSRTITNTVDRYTTLGGKSLSLGFDIYSQFDADDYAGTYTNNSNGGSNVYLEANAGSKYSAIRNHPDSIWLSNDEGNISIETIDATADTTNFKPLAWNPSTKRVIKHDYWPSGGGTSTWQQSLTAGSTLTTNNSIAMGTTSFAMDGSINGDQLIITNSNTGNPISLTTTGNGIGIQAYIGTGTGIYLSGGDNAELWDGTSTQSNTNSLRRVSIDNLLTTGTVAADFGLTKEYWLESSTATTGTVAAKDAIRWSDPTHASRTTWRDFYGMDNAVEERFMNIQPTLVRINNDADTLATLDDVRSGGGSVTASSTTTFTNKRWIPRQDSAASSATSTPGALSGNTPPTKRT